MRRSAARRMILPPYAMDAVVKIKSRSLARCRSAGASSACAPPAGSVSLIKVEDASGASLAGATVSDAANHSLGRTASSGTLAVACTPPCRITISAPGFAPQTLVLTAPETIHLQPTAGAEQITVTAYRAPLGYSESPAATTRVLSQQALAATAGITLDDQLRQLPGVELLPPISIARCQPRVARHQPARPRFHFRFAHTRHGGGRAPQRSARRLDPLAGTAKPIDLSDIELGREAPAISTVPAPSAASSKCRILCTPSPTPSCTTSTDGAEGAYDDQRRCSRKSNSVRGACSCSGYSLGTYGYIQESPYQRGPVDVPARQQRPQPEMRLSPPKKDRAARSPFEHYCLSTICAAQRHALPVQRHAYFCAIHRYSLV